MQSFLEKLGIEIPLIQAPMAGVSTPELASAVSNARALGSISIGALQPDVARKEIQKTQALTPYAFNVNVFCHRSESLNPTVERLWLKQLTPFFQELSTEPLTELREIYTSFNQNEPMLEILLEEQPAVVSFHFGLPPKHMIDALHQKGIILIATATNLQEAKAIEGAGLDGIVAQGIEAGGHRGLFNPDASDERLGTLVLTRLLVKNTNLPIIAAGGIMDGAGIKAVLSLGAQAAQLGTAFIACPESSADADYRTAILQPAFTQTSLIKVISGRPARGFRNKLSELEQNPDCPVIPAYPYAYAATKVLNSAAKKLGILDFAVHWAGQGVGMSRAMSASELVQTLKQELLNA